MDPVFITVDPKRDTPTVLRDYKAENGWHPRFVMLTGTLEAISRTAKNYRAYFSTPEGDEEDYLVDHSLHAYLLDKSGEVLDIYGRNVPAHELASRIRKHMIDEARLAEEDSAIELQKQLIKKSHSL